MDQKLLTHGLLILISFIWAGSFIVVKTITTEIDPIDLGFLRFLVATPLMLILLLSRGRDPRLTRKAIPSLIILGLTGVTFLYLFQFIGINLTNASTASVLINTNPIFIALLSAFFLPERFSVKKMLGILLSFLGVVVVVFSNLSNGSFTVNNLVLMGSIFVLLSALCWAIYSVVGKRMLKLYDNLTITTYAFCLGTLFFPPFVLSDISIVFRTISVNGWLSILYLAVGCSLFGYIGWYYALQRTEASKAAVFLNFIPIFTIMMSYFLGEPITWFFLIGAILIIYGVYLTQKS